MKDWAGQKDLLVKLAGAMPDDKLGFKPTPAQRSYGEHILHIAQVNVALLAAVGGKAPAPTIDMKATTKAAMIKQMTDSFDYGAALLKEFDNTTIQGTVTQPFGMGPGDARACVLLPRRAHAGHLRPDGRVSAPQRRRAAGESAAVTPGLRHALKVVPAYNPIVSGVRNGHLDPLVEAREARRRCSIAPRRTARRVTR